MSDGEHDTARVTRALDAAKRGDRDAFDREWDAASEGERWRIRAHARIGAIVRAAQPDDANG